MGNEISAPGKHGLYALEPKNKEPGSARILNSWINQSQARVGTTAARLGWLVAATVVSAALQRVVDSNGAPLFLLKGGTMLQYRLPAASRATKDLDGLVRGDLDSFIAELDDSLSEPWGPLTLVRTSLETIDAPARLVKPRRFTIATTLNGVTWRSVQVEIAADEGNAGASPDTISAPPLEVFGLPRPEALTTISLAYQAAQKIHACTGPHKPPEFVNNRARDIVDLILIRRLIDQSRNFDEGLLLEAIEDVFDSRAREAEVLGLPTRTWPVEVVALPHWGPSFERAAHSGGLSVSLDDAVGEVNSWLRIIQKA